MKQQQRFIQRLAAKFHTRTRRRSDELANIRVELQRRGVKVDQITDPELEAAISDGQRVLGSASVRGSDVTGAFVVLVRHQEKL